MLSAVPATVLTAGRLVLSRKLTQLCESEVMVSVEHCHGLPERQSDTSILGELGGVTDDFESLLASQVSPQFRRSVQVTTWSRRVEQI